MFVEEQYKILLETNISFQLLFKDLIENMKMIYFFCFKNIFIFSNFVRNIGGFIILILLIIQIICIILLCKKNSINKINQFIFVITNLYIDYKVRKNKLKKNFYNHRKKK